ncbi:holo-ACP synthase [Syntrophus aciditrophicus]|uniref:Holo-[acyl-carrier-protein] synthase n=1 Tax=Syntrophus aciditrophicus (strain SB) TaxID=56780 RepID=ACPS_SYNAS|nr:holo-ACP synthase [Syntrophus aciditrophicus]Q2LTJ7.1 RecName: Full=Holo-[acyl-carrier-protein] synthase; Short=Holo-ACP synthase; AltName: Full=4'-phosphopantetheinyl transferase AcpS [Syntrophus aciditrophicus SB]ABC77408.1 Holo- synthase [Syntrophus aciditrophicus SB]
MVHGTGIDLVDIDRLEKILMKWDMSFLKKVFSPAEIEYCAKRAFPAIHYAARFAAKESFLKSLGMGIGMGIPLKDIEVRNDPLGRPVLNLYGKALEILEKRGITTVHVSLSHSRSQAGAVVILEGLKD